MRYIGVDIGATWIKSAILDTEGGVLHRHARRFPEFLPSEDARVKEVHVATVVERVGDDVAAFSTPYYGPIEGIVLTGQMGGSLGPGGRWVSWQDRRSSVFDANYSTLAQLVADDLGIKPVFAPPGDHQCALFGARLKAGEVSINVGTGSQVSVLSDAPAPCSRHQNRPYFDGKWLRCVTHIPAGRALNGILRLIREATGLCESSAWELVAEKVKVAIKTDLRWNLSFWPSNLDEHGGSLLGILEDNLNIGEVFLAAFSAMAERYWEMACGLCGPDAGADGLVFSGGLARSQPKLVEKIVERFGNPVWRMADDPDETLSGLFLLVKEKTR